ncbi:MAG: response regulator [Chloroflexi bacterium]|nr:response regulator [Chloroflexota bacterium]
MLTFLRSLIVPPIFEDVERTRVARHLHYLLLLSVPVTVVFSILPITSTTASAAWNHAIAAFMAIFLSLIFGLSRRGYVRLAATLMISSALLAIILSSVMFGGIRNPGMVMTPLILTVCCVLLGSRVTVVFGVMMAVVIGLLFMFEQTHGAYPQTSIVDPNYLAVVWIVIGLTVVELHFTVNQIVQGAQRIHQQALELQDKNQQLEQVQNMLKARTHELSNLNTELQFEISERTRAETILRQKQKLESIGLLAGGVAHDFNNLLTSILSQSSLALRQLTPNQPAYQHLGKSIKSIQRAADLTRQLLAYAGKSTFQIEPLDLNDLIQENHELLEIVIQKNSTLFLDLQHLLPTIESDRGQLQQVLMNLVINAAEAIQHDNGIVRVTTRAVVLGGQLDPLDFVGQAPRPGEYVVLSVQDDGIGMTPAVLESIFDPYFTTKTRGHGLGLSAVLGVIHALQGGLQVLSRPGHGSCFLVYLPASSQGALHKPPPTHGQFQPPTDTIILVVDDEEAVREAAVEILQSAGYRTLAAANGDDGLALFRHHHAEIGMVLLDVLMPGINGPETMEILRTIDQNVKVILTSGYSEQAIFSPAQRQKPNGFLPKPYTIEVLLSHVASVLNATPVGPTPANL